MKKITLYLVFGIIMSIQCVRAQNIALNKPITVSSQEGSHTPKNAAVDGNPNTRWSSEFNDAEWLYVDLESITSFDRLKITWENAYGKSYNIQVASNTEGPWQTLRTITDNTNLTNDFSGLAASGRYVRIYGVERATVWGYSIFELEIYQEGSDDTTDPGGSDNGGSDDTDDSDDDIDQPVDSDNLALFKTVVTSSSENNSVLGSSLVDGDFSTRWSSLFTDAEWLYIDFGSAKSFDRLKITWEAAYAKGYDIQVANSTSGPWETLRTITQNTSLTNDHSGLAAYGRYLRINGIERATPYGYSIYELEVYEQGEPPVEIPVVMPYVQYLELGFLPADLNATDELITQNTDRVYTLLYYPGMNITFTANDFRGEDTLHFRVVDQDNKTIRTSDGSLTTMAYDGLSFYVELIDESQTETPIVGNGDPVANAGSNQTILLTGDHCLQLTGTDSTSPNGEISSYTWTQVSGPSSATISNSDAEIATACDLIEGTYYFRLSVADASSASAEDDVKITVEVPEVYDFSLATPANEMMITNTRYPTFTWDEVEGATRYDVYVNITRDDYDWYASGNLLDRYTKVGESSTNSFTMPTALVDRWTYKWYVIAATNTGEKTSNKQQFAIYLPTFENEPDGISIVNGARDCNKNGIIEPYEDWTLPVEERVDDLLSRLTLEEKYRQCFYNHQEVDGFSFSYGIEENMLRQQYEAAQTSSGIPIAFCGDKIHGWKTIFPTQLGMAATRDMDLVYQCGDLQRREQKSFGFTGTLAPLAEVNTKVLYPRFQEGAGENADEVSAMVRALVAGMQGGPEINPHSILITMKHWPGQGGGGEGILQYDKVSVKYHMKPWEAVVDANAASVMPGYNSAPFLDPTLAGANSSKPIIDYLRDEIEFKGFVVTDWLASSTEQSVESMNAGIDVIGGAPSNKTDPVALVAAIGEARLDEAVSRVLDMKFRLGLFENPYGDTTATWTNESSHAIALQAARQSITVLKNDQILPLNSTTTSSLVIGGPRATWDLTIYDPNVIWQSIYYDNPQTKTYVEAFSDRALEEGMSLIHNDNGVGDVAIVVIGEKSYTHGSDWPNKTPVVPQDQIDIIQGFKDRGIPVVSVILSPRPYVLTDVMEISDAVLLTYRGGNGIAQAVAELCFGDYNPTGKLPFQLPRSEDQIGTDNVHNQLESWDIPYDLGATALEREEIRSYIDAGLEVPTDFGNPLFPYGYGLQSLTETSNLATVTNNEATTLELFPNPATTDVSVQYELNVHGVTKISIFNIFNELQGIVFDEYQSQGTHAVSIDVSGLSTGMYIIEVESGDEVYTSTLFKE